MAMPEMAQRWTREMVLALPEDGNRYELFDGELLVSPAPGLRHQWAITLLLEKLWPYVRANRVGQVLTSPADLDLGGEQLSQPDFFVLPWLPRNRSSWREVPNPILVVEVLSPGTARSDRVVKRPRFQRAGIPEYWIVDLDARLIERWRPQDLRPEILDETLEWHPPGAPSPLVIGLPQLFAEIDGDQLP
jgi:Uma2 family endonuclease